MAAPTSSQGVTFPGVTGATKVTVKKSRNKTAKSRLDASTLALATGAERVYEDGLADNGAGGTAGVITTATVEFLGTTKPVAGSVLTYGGTDLKCTESESSDAAGELKKGTATYTSDFVP
jgi:hypothetical protein